MTPDLIPFAYGDQSVRVVTIDGEPWFVGTDVARILGYSNPSDALTRVDPRDRSAATLALSEGSREVTRERTLINESGVWMLTVGSSLPDAREFQRWATHEVLPSIRKHGGYLTPAAIEQTLTDPDFIIRLATQLRDEKRRRWQAETEIESQRQHLRLVEPKAAAFDRWMGSGAEYPIDVAAKALAAAGYFTGRNRLFDEFGDLGWAYKDKAGWHPYQQHGPEGTKRLTVRVHYFDDPESGEARGKTTLKVTAKGIADLAKVHGILPDAIKDAMERSAA